ncbi:hypothetical protein ACI65C_004682 [Semiaphis heraclei]
MSYFETTCDDVEYWCYGTTEPRFRNGKELSQERSVSNGIIESITSGTTKTANAELGFTFGFFSPKVGGSLQFEKSKTRENTIETTFTTGTTVSYSLTTEQSIQKEEVVICTAKAGQGVKLLARTNAVHFHGHYCIYDRTGGCPERYNKSHTCKLLDFTMLPFNGNAISADIKCSRDDQTTSPDTDTSCLPFDSVCTHASKCCGNTYCHYANPKWAKGRCYNRL